MKNDGIFLNNKKLPKIEVEDLLFLKELIEKNKLKPVLDRIYPTEEIDEAHRYVDKGHKKGNVAITLDYNNKKKIIKNDKTFSFAGIVQLRQHCLKK